MQREVQSWRQTETELGTDRQRDIETEGEGELWVNVETRRETDRQRQ